MVLRRGAPVAMDVLVSLIGQTSSEEKVVPCEGSVTNEGNLILQISEYDPMEIVSLSLVVVPILADKHFLVQWGSLPADVVDKDDMDVPKFTRCDESTLLRERYRPCKGGGNWKTQPIVLNISRWFPDLTPYFEVVLAELEGEAGLWPVRRRHTVELQFNGVDRPAAWSAQHRGCDFFTTEHEEWKFALIQSSDAMCTLLEEGCIENHKTRFCSAIKAALTQHHTMKEDMEASKLMQLLACFQPFDSNETCYGKDVGRDHPDGATDRFHGPGPYPYPQLWKHHLETLEFQGYLMEGTYMRTAVAIPQDKVFSYVRMLDSKDVKPYFFNASLDVISNMFRATALPSDPKTLKYMMRMWFTEALHTGCLELIEKLIDKLKGTCQMNLFPI